MKKEVFGALPDGTPVELYALTNEAGLEARLMTYGAILLSLRTPDRAGEFDDVVLGYDDLEGYSENRPYLGATIGRCANRIAGGRFVLNGVTHRLATNDGPHHLHGGVRGFHKVLWSAEPFRDEAGEGVRFRHRSPNGEEGYPGNLEATVTYRLTRGNALQIDYEAVTDRTTLVNLTHHSYWALGGQGARDILGHMLTLEADRYTVVDAALIPTGELRDVQGTPMDFTRPRAIGERIAEVGGGYDHNYVLRRRGDGLALAARLFDPKTGRVLEIETTEPGIQLYSGHLLEGTRAGKGGRSHSKYAGLCLETQHFPDAPHHPHFPSIVLEPGHTYRTTTSHRFSTLPGGTQLG